MDTQNLDFFLIVLYNRYYRVPIVERKDCMLKKEIIKYLEDMKQKLKDISEDSSIELINQCYRDFSNCNLAKTNDTYNLYMGKHTDLNYLDVFSAAEASQRWGFNENYVKKEYKKKPQKFLEGSIRLFGTTYIITREGMEHLTGLTEESATSWVIWHEKDNVIDLKKYKSSEIEYRHDLALLYLKENKKKNTVHYSNMDDKISFFYAPDNGRYCYAKKFYFNKYLV